MRRFYFNSEQRTENMVLLSVEESRHISRVLRLKQGDRVELFDGSGTIFSAVIVNISQMVSVKIVSQQTSRDENWRKIIICQSIIKNRKMELLLQKCTELGVNQMIPFVASRCQGNVVRQFSGKGERWRKIIEEACKQCLRPLPMHLQEIQTFKDILAMTDENSDTIKLLLWEKEEERKLSYFKRQLQENKRIFLMFGPEGGFAEEEVIAARGAGWQTVGLGETVLRAETAVLASVAIVQHQIGNM